MGEKRPAIDGPALVPGQEHGDPFGDAGADQVTGGGAATVVEKAGRHPGRLTGGAPRGAPVPDGDAVAGEDQWAVGVAACPPSCQGLGNRLETVARDDHRSAVRSPQAVPQPAQDRIGGPSARLPYVPPRSSRAAAGPRMAS